MNPSKYGYATVQRQINDRWCVELTVQHPLYIALIETLDSVKLMLSVVPIPTHWEYYMLGNRCNRKITVTANVSRKPTMNDRRENVLARLKVVFPSSISLVLITQWTADIKLDADLFSATTT